MSIVTAMPPSMASVVAAFLLLGSLNAGTPLLIASTPVSAAQPEENARSSRKPQASPARPSENSAAGAISQVRRSRPAGGRPRASRTKPEQRHPDDRDHEGVGRDRERRPRLPDPAQVHRHEDQDDDDRRDRLVPAQRGDRRGRVLRPRGHRHRDGQHVVDEQRAGDGEPGPDARGSSSRPRSRRRRRGRRARSAGTTATTMSMTKTTASPIQRRGRVGGHAGDGEGEEDLVRRVGDRRQRVGGEDRQRDALGQQRLAQALAVDRPADEQPLERVGERQARRPS